MATATTQLTEADYLAMAQSGDDHAFEQLVNHYNWLIRSRARRFFVQGGEYEDLIQEALLGFFKAVRDYRSSAGSFRSFAELCITRQVVTAVKTASRQKHAPLNSATSLDASQFNYDGDRTLGDVVPDRFATFEPRLAMSEDVQTILQTLKARLSPFEYSALTMWLDGHSYEQIARKLDRHWKSVDNGLWRVKCKIRRYLEAGIIDRTAYLD